MSSDDYFDSMMRYKLTGLGAAVTNKLSELIRPHLPNLLGDFEQALQNEAEEQKPSDKGKE